jgi:hypothetical protein
MKHLGRAALIVLMVVFFSGCAVFKGEKVPETVLPKLDGANTTKPSISYDITSMSGIVKVDKSADIVQNIIAGELLNALEESNYFSRIAKNDKDADVNLSVVMTNSGSPAAFVGAVITGLSLYTIPSWATDNFDLQAKAGNKAGMQKEYTLSDSTTLVQWLPMMFVFPFKHLGQVPEVRKNMYRHLLLQMKNDGLLTLKK